MQKMLLSLVLAAPGLAFASPSPAIDCTYAPSQSKLVAGLTGALGGSGATLAALGQATGMTVVTHSSGAAILTGSAGYVAGTLGSVGAAPFIVGVALVVGGTAVTVELICAPKNHPEQVAKVRQAADAFSLRYQQALAATKTSVAKAGNVAAPVATQASIAVKRVGTDALDYAYRQGAALRSKLPG